MGKHQFLNFPQSDWESHPTAGHRSLSFSCGSAVGKPGVEKLEIQRGSREHVVLSPVLEKASPSRTEEKAAVQG